MKNIIITGVARSGKTTLSKLIKKKYPKYNIISFEAIRNGFVKSQPDLRMGNRNSEARKEILPEYIMEFIHWNNTITTHGSIIEGDFANIKTIKELSNEDFNKRNIDEFVYDNNYYRPSYALNYKTLIEYRTQLGFN